MKGIIVERLDTITIIRINRPEKRNAIDYDTAIEMGNAVTDFENDEKASVLILTGDERAFCAGADLTDTERLTGRVLSPEGPLGFTRRIVSKPVIAAISGFCVAGGFEIALWADIRVADETAFFGFLERRFGVPLIDGGTQRLSRIVGLGRALDLILTGKTIDAKEARDIGIVNYFVSKGDAVKRAVDIAKTISSYPQVTLRNDRKAVIYGIGTSLSGGLEIEGKIGKESIENHGMDSVDLFIRGMGRSGKPIERR